MEFALDEMAAKIAKMHPSADNMIVLGMASRGIPLAQKLSKRLSEKFGKPIETGSLDATFYRDDFHYRKKLGSTEMRFTEMPASVEGKVVILVDDVLYTGRSVRAALQAILDFGRPSVVRLCVLVDREAMCRQVRSDLDEAYSKEKHGESCPAEMYQLLMARNAQCRPIWKPMHMQPLFRVNPFVTARGEVRDTYVGGKGDTSVSADVFERGLCLPSDNKMSPEDQDVIIRIIRRCFA